MARQSPIPEVETEIRLEPSAQLVGTEVDMPERVLRDKAARYILVGAGSLTEGEMEMSHAAVSDRMARAEAFGFTPRDVLLSLLRPALSSGGHCRCHSCRQRCAICGATGTGD